MVLHGEPRPIPLGDGANRRGLGNITGRDGGRALNLRRFARDGVRLLGRIQAIDGAAIALAPDLAASLAAVDRRTGDFREAVDAYIDAPDSTRRPTSRRPTPGSLAMPTCRIPRRPSTCAPPGITSVVWATGYGWDLAWLRLPGARCRGRSRATPPV